MRWEFNKMELRKDYEDTMRESVKTRCNELGIRQAEFELLVEKAELNQLTELEESRLTVLKIEIENLQEKGGQTAAQKLKEKWIKMGEKQNKYFLNLTKAQAKRTSIKILKLGEEEIHDEGQVNKEIGHYYKELYETATSVEKSILEHFLGHIQPLEVDMIEQIEKPIAQDEILRVLRSCKDSTPGPDGIPYSIYKYVWPVIKDTLTILFNEIQEAKELPTSWKLSTLKLLPKPGKDSTLLKNWRPITLANCDQKLYTKILTKRLTSALEGTIGYHQTAYMTGRSISDNLRLLNNAYLVAERTKKPLIVISLDARKAFDSAEHETIEEILTKLKLGNFTKIFKRLYEAQRVLIENGNLVIGNYNIKRGVKQGDSLSCILFILVIEMLLKEINLTNIQKFEHNGYIWPTALGYADDVTVICTNEADVQKIFDIYERFSKATGLELNADKTEMQIMNLPVKEIRITYKSQEAKITHTENIKINGVNFLPLAEERKQINWAEVIDRTKQQMRRWTPRKLTLIGKVITIKTFGFSQSLFLSRVIPPDEKSLKELRKIIQHFLWSKNMSGNLAPARIKNTTIERPTSQGGLGLGNLKSIIQRMNYIQIMVNSKQNSLAGSLNNRMTNHQSMFPEITPHCDNVMLNYVTLKRQATLKLIEENKDINRLTDELKRNTYVYELLEEEYKKGIWGFLYRKNKKRITDIDYREILSKIKKEFRKLVTDSVDAEPVYQGRSIPEEKRHIKALQTEYDPILCFRSGIIMSTYQLSKCMFIQKKIVSTWAKTIIFRYMHGDLTTNEKLFRTGMAESPLCEYCEQQDDYNHRYNDCENNGSLNELLMDITDGRCSNLNETLSDPLIKPKQLMIIGYLIPKMPDFKSRKLLPLQHYLNLEQMFNKIQS